MDARSASSRSRLNASLSQSMLLKLHKRQARSGKIPAMQVIPLLHRTIPILFKGSVSMHITSKPILSLSLRHMPQ
jgi:hypothetical protein